MSSPDPHPGTRAADVLQVTLEDRRLHPVSKAARVVASFAIAVFSGGDGGDEALPGMDLVVTRRDTGAEVLRVAAGQPQEADRMLQATRRDLETMSVEGFVRAWRSIED